MGNHFRKVVIRMTFDAALERLKYELGQQGFDVTGVTDYHHSINIPIQVTPGRYTVLTVFHPALYQAMMHQSPFEGTILPCYLSVVESHPAETSIVPFNVTQQIVAAIPDADLNMFAAEVSTRIDRAVAMLQNDQSWAPDLVTSWE
jgi:uncharacterized protein (DUF302 family)